MLSLRGLYLADDPSADGTNFHFSDIHFSSRVIGNLAAPLSVSSAEFTTDPRLYEDSEESEELSRYYDMEYDDAPIEFVNDPFAHGLKAALETATTSHSNVDLELLPRVVTTVGWDLQLPPVSDTSS